MKIAAVCCTYLRPRQLAAMLECFLAQDYLQRELVILDDAGQYPTQRGDRWRLVSVARRYATLGEKRNAAAALVAADVEALAVWDDDDGYLPWALRASAAALERADWSRPSRVLMHDEQGTLWARPTRGRFHGGWAYRRAAFERAGGYPSKSNGEDQALAARLAAAGATEADPCRLGFAPFYVYGWQETGSWHLSAMAGDGYRRLGALRAGDEVFVKSDRPDDGPRQAPLLKPTPPPTVDAALAACAYNSNSRLASSMETPGASASSALEARNCLRSP